MYKNKCNWCNKNIEVEKQCLFALHIANCDKNPNKKLRNIKNSGLLKNKEKVKRIVISQKCPKCGKEFEIKIREALYKRNRYKKFCSRKCANGRIWSEEHKKRLSTVCKTSEKVKIANKRNIKKLKQSGRYRGSGKYNIKYSKEFTCLYCGNIGYECGYNKNRKYHDKCWKKISGGIKNGSSRGKSGWYKGYWCDSSYELAFIIYNIEHNISIERNKKWFNYKWNNKTCKYYPDFRVNGVLHEIKNYESELTNVKLKSVDEKIIIYYKNTMKPFLNYVTNKYGKNFIKLYEKHPQTVGSSNG